MSLTKVRNQMIEGAAVNVLDFMSESDAALIRAGNTVGQNATAVLAGIHAAIASAPNLPNQYADTIYFPAGEYLINGAITVVNHGIVFKGESPYTVRITSNNSAEDVIFFNRAVPNNGYRASVINITTNGGLNGIHIYGAQSGADSVIQNVNINVPANAGLLIDGDLANPVTNGTYIYGNISNLRIGGNYNYAIPADVTNKTAYGIYVKGYNMINATTWTGVTISGVLTGMHIEETVSTGAVTLWNGLAIEGTAYNTITNIGTDMEIHAYYSEKIGGALSTADININSSLTFLGNVTLIKPFFGFQLAASVGAPRVSFKTNYCTVSIIDHVGNQPLVIDGQNYTAAAYIFLSGSTSVFCSVLNFSNKEIRSFAAVNQVNWSGANFTADSGQTWTVDVADQVDYSYVLNGDQATISFYFANTSVSGACSGLQIATPFGISALRTQRTIGGATVSGVPVPMIIQVNPGSPFIYCYKMDGTNWAASTNLTNVFGQFTFVF